jgi:hypothetical protein
MTRENCTLHEPRPRRRFSLLRRASASEDRPAPLPLDCTQNSPLTVMRLESKWFARVESWSTSIALIPLGRAGNGALSAKLVEEGYGRVCVGRFCQTLSTVRKCFHNSPRYRRCFVSRGRSAFPGGLKAAASAQAGIAGRADKIAGPVVEDALGGVSLQEAQDRNKRRFR